MTTRKTTAKADQAGQADQADQVGQAVPEPSDAPGPAEEPDADAKGVRYDPVGDYPERPLSEARAEDRD